MTLLRRKIFWTVPIATVLVLSAFTQQPPAAPSPIVLQGCSVVGCPAPRLYPDWQTVHDDHADVPAQGSTDGEVYPPCFDATGYDPGSCM